MSARAASSTTSSTTLAVRMTLTETLYEIAQDPSARNRPDLRVIVNDKIETRRSRLSER